VLAPLLLLPLFLTDNTPSKRCMYVVVLMITYWVTEALPLAISSMLPILLFPVLDIMSTDKITLVYMKEPVVMLVAGIMIALSIEFCNLHTRVALKVVQLIGCSQRRLHFGLMLITMFISMWISNTATISMMCPIVMAVLEQMETQGLCEMYEDPPIVGTSNINIAFPSEPEPKRPTKITLCYMLGIAYATSIGGTGTLVGTGPNMAFKGIFESEFPALSVSFPNWMASVSVTMLVSTVLTFVWLQVLYMGMFRPNSKAARAATFGAKGEEVASETINERYKALGPMSSHEIAVGCLFLLAVVLFVARRPGFAEGWADAIIALKSTDVGFDEYAAR
jgi:solute carrier family 13 (sodium-dependent dicarboxylate transporter), member 2/3/5